MSEKKVIPLYNSKFYQTRADEILKESIEWTNAGEYRYAKERIECAMTYDPDNKEVLSLAGYVYYALEEYEKSLECVERVLHDNATDIQTGYVYGLVLMRSKKFQEARNVFEGILCFEQIEKKGYEQHKCNVMYYLHLTYFELKQYDKSLVLLQELEYLHSCIEVIWFEMARIYFLQSRYKDAVSVLEKTVLRDPEFRAAYSMLIESCIRKQWYSKAVQWLEKEILYFPEKQVESERRIRTLQKKI